VSVLGKRQQGALLNVKAPGKIGIDNMKRINSPAALMDNGRWVLILTSVPVILLAFILASDFTENQSGLGFITPNFVNTCLLGMALLFHQRPSSFLSALDEATGGCSGILIQFPLYFGIMGVMKGSGLITEISYAFSSISNPDTFPVLSFFSAGVTNIMVPSGGGQWAVQGPILIQGAMDLGVPLEKAVLSLAYGDQITNMMQPFWALPLLGITGLKARQILPYSLILMLVGGIIYTAAMWWG
jgi:short-chain fatty acids transporter